MCSMWPRDRRWGSVRCYCVMRTLLTLGRRCGGRFLKGFIENKKLSCEKMMRATQTEESVNGAEWRVALVWVLTCARS